MLFVNKTPDNSAPFQELSANIRKGCTVEEFASVVPRTNPTPAQIFQTLEIVLLSDIQKDTKPPYLTVLNDYISRSLRKVPGGDEPIPDLSGMMAAYEDAGRLITFCQSRLEGILQNTRGTEDFSADDINSYQFAKLQDTLRVMLRLKRLPFEERSPYTDPAPKALERSHQDFLDGLGTLDRSEIDEMISCIR